MGAKECALRDMASSGLVVSYLFEEKSILELTKVVDEVRVDFRVFNGGHNRKNYKNK